MWKAILEHQDFIYVVGIAAGIGSLVGMWIANKMIQRYIKKEFGVEL